MVREVFDSPEFICGSFTKKAQGNKRYITFEYDSKLDEQIIENIEEVINSQKLCTNCVHSKEEGSLGGYMTLVCDVDNSCLEYCDHPHHDCDGSNCRHYERK